MSSQTKFFGIELAHAWHETRAAWADMLGWRVFRWLSPTFAVNLHGAQGKVWVTPQSANAACMVAGPQRSQFVGCLIPEEMLLWRQARFPLFSAERLRAAAEMEVASFSPFLAEDVVWCHAPPTQVGPNCIVNIAITSRKLINPEIRKVCDAGTPEEAIELWAKLPSSDLYVGFEGFGERARKTLGMRVRAIYAALLLLLLGAAVAAALTPLVQLRFQALDALGQYAKVRAVAEPALKQKEELIQLVQRNMAAHEILDKRIQPEKILLRITQLLPDDTYISSLRVQSGKVSITGLTPNAAAFLQHLSAQPAITEVKTPTASVRQRGADKESFTVEFTIGQQS